MMVMVVVAGHAQGCIAVSYPFGVLTWILMGHLLNLAKTEKPCLWVIGTEDNFTSVSRFRQRYPRHTQHA